MSRLLTVSAAAFIAMGAAPLYATVQLQAFPLPLSAYSSEAREGVFEVLAARAGMEPFNLIATGIFVLAIVHTFLTARFRRWAHSVEASHSNWLKAASAAQGADDLDGPTEISFRGQLLHFLGEVEAVFGIWAVVLMIAIGCTKGWGTVVDYVGTEVNFTEAMFVVVIMALASTRPIFVLAEDALRALAAVGRHSVGAWWLVILIVAPILGSFITEPAAMTIGALLLAAKFYVTRPSLRLSYATLGLLFVNVSVGGTLTHFAAPPVLMVAGPWGWDIGFMFTNFGWKAVIGITCATGLTYALHRGEFRALEATRSPSPSAESLTRRSIPRWITGVHVGFIVLTVAVAHHPPLFIGAFLFFLAFSQATAHHQDKLDLRPPLLVGFFLAGLVIHGGLQGWWIEPVLSRLAKWPLFSGATLLTGVNDNAAITYLATLVPGFTDQLKYAVVAGAVTGGGLTVIANAPNPAGQAILQRFFPDGVSPLGLLLGALLPTAVMAAAFMLL